MKKSQLGMYVLGAVDSNRCSVAAYVVGPAIVRSSQVSCLSVLLLHDIELSVGWPPDTMSTCGEN